MTEQTNEPNLSIADIQVLKMVVEAATSRGAIQADEMALVGSTYDKVTAWLKAVLPEEQDNEQANSEGETDA
jgi:hypothetical protein